MTRIVYLAFSDGSVQGGQKMIFRHVETLRDLGFDAVVWTRGGGAAPAWFEHRAPVEVGSRVPEEDVVVVPGDAPNALVNLANGSRRLVVFSQGMLDLGLSGAEALERFPPHRFPAFLSVAPGLSAEILRFFPDARVELTPCFVDERIFRPAGGRAAAIAFSPRKRSLEAQFCLGAFGRLHPRHKDWAWRRLQNLREADVAALMGGSEVFLSLSRLETVGMTPLEAMACGCICAGFAGVGGRQYATAENGFWVPEDDAYAAVDALAEACDLVRGGGAALDRMREAGFETARRWSYASFRPALEAAWMRLAPEARVRNSPLD